MEDVLRYLPTIIGSGPIFEAVRAHQQARNDTRRYRREAAKLEARIRNAAAAGDSARAAYLRRCYCDAVSARFVAAEIQNKEAGAGHTTLELVEMVRHLNARYGTTEPVNLHYKRKRDGSARPICDFGFQNRVLQQLVLTALEAGASFHPAQFNVAGRGGTHAAKRALRDAYASGHYKYVVQVDVRNCFPSFTATGVAESLPIPRQVTNAVVMLDNLQVTPTYTSARARHHHRAEPPAMTGLPQGSICSTIVQSILLKPLLDVVPATAFAAMWADNLIVLCRTRAEAERTIMDLHQAARSLPSGPVQLTDGGVGRVSSKTEFIGSVFQRRKGRPLIAPSPRAKGDYAASVRGILAQSASESRETAYRACKAGFVSQHRLWPEVEEWTWLRRIVIEGQLAPSGMKHRARRLRRAFRYFWTNL
jgi:hypothetical protein